MTLQSLRYEIRGRLSRMPALYLPLARLRYGSADRCATTHRNAGQMVCPATHLVVEGFPRSGNSFACKAFLIAQRQPLNIAHHSHSPAQVMAASAMGIPTLVIIRQPVQAVCSLLQRDSGITAQQALRGWVRFYECLVDYRGDFISATFDQITTDLGEVTGRLNARFGTAFLPFDPAPENIEHLFRQLEVTSAEQSKNGAVRENEVARPSRQRARERDVVLKRLNGPRLQGQRERAEALYAQFRRWAAG